MTQKEFDLHEFLPYRLSVVAQKLSEGFAKQYRQKFAISTPEWRVLAHIHQDDGASVRDIEQRVAMEKSKVSRAAKRLEHAGYLTKRVNPNDRRRVHLDLTQEGHELMARLLPIALAYQRRLSLELGEHFKPLEQGLDQLLNRKTGNSL